MAARVSDASPAPCVESVGRDTAGWTADGNELVVPGSCVVEEALQPWNMGSRWVLLLVNFADLEVCTSTEIHPDGAFMVRSYPQSGSGPDDTFCYTGVGAALNDIDGIERDAFGQYYSEEQYCHYIQQSGFEVPGASGLRPEAFRPRQHQHPIADRVAPGDPEFFRGERSPGRRTVH